MKIKNPECVDQDEKFRSSSGHVSISSLFCLLIFLTLAGCDARKIQKPGNADDGGADSGALAGLTIVGYNYTDREIAQFSVNGAGGGNVHVSGPNGGGGGSVCCVRYVPGNKAREYKIRWHAASCRYGESGSGASYSYDLHRFYKDHNVEVEELSAGKAGYFEVHFFPDGTVKARVTAEASPPILSLPRDRTAPRSPQCPNNVEPPPP